MRDVNGFSVIMWKKGDALNSKENGRYILNAQIIFLAKSLELTRHSN